MSPIRIHGHGGRGVAVAGECLRVEDRLALARQGTFLALTGTRGLDTVAEAVCEAFPGMIAEVDFAATLRGAAT
jgi:Pyruvate/2-oxoacid:ferredoxin oxidoreductase gamma subunit